jgi:S-(hydroxymethyl)glutathione dehydrogenase/alcohol dehydrogenase
VQAALYREIDAPLTIESIDIDKPIGREVLVRTVAAGVCHSDLHIVHGLVRRGVMQDDAMVLGHESAGIAEAVGPQVTYLQPGDHVVGCLSGFCGVCEQCLSGHPNLCQTGLQNKREGETPRLSQNGRPVGQAYGIGGFAERLLLHENSLVRIDPEIPLDRAALVGCGVLTGVGAALRTAAIQAGQTIAVFGCGGVGLSVIQGARIAGALQIIAVDQFDSKLEMAKRFGATHTVNGRNEDAVAAIRSMTNGAGGDHALEAVGNTTLIRQAVESLAIRGTATIVGVPPADASIEFPWLALRAECKLQTSRMGSNRFRFDIPRYLEFYRQGKLLLDEMVSREGSLSDINEAFRAMEAGEVARTVLKFD